MGKTCLPRKAEKQKVSERDREGGGGEGDRARERHSQQPKEDAMSDNAGQLL